MAITQASFPIIRMGAADDQLTGIENVNYLHWVSPDAVAGDELLVKDDDDNIVWDDVADGAYVSKLHVVKQPINKLKITTMTSGRLYVIVEPPRGFNT